jgi:hypothetical protein
MPNSRRIQLTNQHVKRRSSRVAVTETNKLKERRDAQDYLFTA